METSANPIDTNEMPWVPLRAGISMKPLHFEEDGYALHLKVEPGAVITRHRHTGEVHALNLTGYREIVDTMEVIGPGEYVFEPAGNEDCWQCYGDDACIVHITIKGRVEYLDEYGNVVAHTDRHTALSEYLANCERLGTTPDKRIIGDGC